MLPREVPVLAIEAGVTHFWRAYTGFDGDVIGIDRFGESAPAAHVAEALGLTAAAVVEQRTRLGAPQMRPAMTRSPPTSRLHGGVSAVQAVLFDLDGTLLDTVEDHRPGIEPRRSPSASRPARAGAGARDDRARRSDADRARRSARLGVADGCGRPKASLLQRYLLSLRADLHGCDECSARVYPGVAGGLSELHRLGLRARGGHQQTAATCGRPAAAVWD